MSLPKYLGKALVGLAAVASVVTANAVVVVTDATLDGLHDPEFQAFAGTSVLVGVYVSQTPTEISNNGGLTGFGLFMDTDGLPISGPATTAIAIDPQWDFVTQQSIVDGTTDRIRVVGNTLNPDGLTTEPQRLFFLALDIPDAPGTQVELSFQDAENASFVSSSGLVYDDDVVFLPTTVNIVPIPDSDGDGVDDFSDNCVFASNAGQQDTDADGIGNRCDADLNQDCIVNVQDLGIFRQRFFTNDATADFDSDGIVNVIDLGILRSLFFGAPGPSGTPNICLTN